MATFLDTIIRTKKEEIRLLRKKHPAFRKRSSPCRSLIKELTENSLPGVLAEVKKASPSKGVICENFKPVEIAAAYEEGGALALSVLTDKHYFQGSLNYLESIREKAAIPVLRKDFIIDPLQVEQTAHSNADVMLLIAAAMSDPQLRELYSAADELGIESLFEVHTMEELERIMKLNPRLIGINNRDLASFNVDIATTVTLKKYIPEEIPVISESGIFTKEHARVVYDAGVRGVLVGESLMRSDSPGDLIQELVNAGQN
ncbi:MAG: indole-3-glycerol phosphate synthase TrpC [Chitinivibrionales bacterium]|nr:indole-3-glycerol phosphate synthase TrpC [Chitinivibrionales bacterium]